MREGLKNWFKKERWQGPEGLLILMSVAMALSFTTWMTLLNNFAVEEVAFTGIEIGILQSLREIPGFLAFTAVFLLLILREQTIALLSLALLGLGVSLTGFFPTVYGLYFTTVIMSIGFHYYETMQISLTLQWIGKDRSPIVMGHQISARSFASILAYGLIWLVLEILGLPYAWLYAFAGCATLIMVLSLWRSFPKFDIGEAQHKSMIVRKRYWLFYALVFMGGARRQIFIAFAGFLMVQKFGYDAATITLLFLINHLANIWIAPKIGRFIARMGERQALTLEYVGLIAVFTGYAFVETAWMAAVLYVLDHLFFAFSIAMKSYFQKIADPKDIASTVGVSFSINHIAAVFIPALFGVLWMKDPSMVFLAGALMALISLLLAFNVPRHPEAGNEVVLGQRFCRDPNTHPAE